MRLPAHPPAKFPSFHLTVGGSLGARAVDTPTPLGGGVVFRANESLGGGEVGKLPEADGEEVIKRARSSSQESHAVQAGV